MAWCKIIHGDSLEILRQIESDSVDLIITSPPYAEKRKKTYGGVPANVYPEWFLPIADELYRVLKPDGTFILNIKEHVENGERHIYVLNLILAMKQRGWLWTEEYIWHKKNSYPGKWPNRFRDAWERLLQFNKSRKFKMYQDAVRVQVSKNTVKRIQRPGERDYQKNISATGSGFEVRLSAWKDKNLVYPTNVLHISTETRNRQHSAAFPVLLPEWFIRLFTQPGDLVLDPFVGSGTTCVAAIRQNRNVIGIDISSQYVEIAKKRVQRETGVLCER